MSYLTLNAWNAESYTSAVDARENGALYSITVLTTVEKGVAVENLDDNTELLNAIEVFQGTVRFLITNIDNAHLVLCSGQNILFEYVSDEWKEIKAN